VATLPSNPVTFATGSTPSIALLNQLAYCVTFLNVNQAYTVLGATGSQSVSSSTATAVQWATPTVNRDAGWVSGHATRYAAQTAGYYDLSAKIDFPSNATGARGLFFQVTTQGNNPGGSGNTTQFGGTTGIADQSTDTNLEISQQSPYLYLLDFVEVYAYQTSGGALTLTAAGQWLITLNSLGP
jgi:hypothetical protein